MATRKEITTTFLSELHDTLSQWVGEDDIRLQHPNMDEVFPSIVYRADWKNVEKYGQGAAQQPCADVRNEDGEQIALLYQDFERLRFDLRLKAQSMGTVMDMGEAFHQHFKPYTDHIGGVWMRGSDFHDECQEFAINGGTGDDDGSSEPVSRADIIGVEIEYWRYIRRDGTPLRNVHTVVSVENRDSSNSDLEFGNSPFGKRSIGSDSTYKSFTVE